ncbi:hypothetical protein [Brasilonema sp. UFV-L1]|uniref:hypothetical protein n=1 Tax=Brasilonema sp. UFV-L1 TaxID=2234130 RepID=UPI0030DD8A49
MLLRRPATFLQGLGGCGHKLHVKQGKLDHPKRLAQMVLTIRNSSRLENFETALS